MAAGSGTPKVPTRKGRSSKPPVGKALESVSDARAAYLATYRRIRKPMPPPERVLPDKRRKAQEREAERELREERD
jgi:hypothetical protein